MRLKKLRERVRAILEEFCSDEEGYSEEEGKEGCPEEGCTSDDQRYKEEAECSEVVRITNEDVASSFACDVVYTNTPNTKASKQGWLKGIRKTNSELRTRRRKKNVSEGREEGNDKEERERERERASRLAEERVCINLKQLTALVP
jgi:hypothetical protein